MTQQTTPIAGELWTLAHTVTRMLSETDALVQVLRQIGPVDLVDAIERHQATRLRLIQVVHQVRLGIRPAMVDLGEAA